MAIIEYKLHRVGRKALRAPEWVEDGGYWPNPTDHTLVGWVLDEADREYYIPDTVTYLTRESFIARIRTIHEAESYYKGEPTENNQEVMTLEEVETWAGDWFDNFHSS